MRKPRTDYTYDWYLSGPLSSTGKLEDNIAVFQSWARQLRDRGWRVFCPPEGEELGKKWDDYMRRDLAFLTQCAGLALLPGWEESKGALLERDIAERLGMPCTPVEAIQMANTPAAIARDKPGMPHGVPIDQLFFDVPTMEPKTVLQEAELLVTRERGNVYGPPEQDFTRTAGMVTALFEHKLKDGETITSADIARIMICLKVSRSVWAKKRDNWVDAAGYAACGFRCEEGKW